MQELGLGGRLKSRFRATTDSTHRFPVAPNVLMRDFEVEVSNTAFRRGDCSDNAVAESFFGTPKMELLYELPLQTASATRNAVADYIGVFYNVRRQHSSLGLRKPGGVRARERDTGGPSPRTTSGDE